MSTRTRSTLAAAPHACFFWFGAAPPPIPLLHHRQTQSTEYEGGGAFAVCVVGERPSQEAQPPGHHKQGGCVSYSDKRHSLPTHARLCQRVMLCFNGRHPKTWRARARAAGAFCFVAQASFCRGAPPHPLRAAASCCCDPCLFRAQKTPRRKHKGGGPPADACGDACVRLPLVYHVLSLRWRPRDRGQSLFVIPARRSQNPLPCSLRRTPNSVQRRPFFALAARARSGRHSRGTQGPACRAALWWLENAGGGGVPDAAPRMALRRRVGSQATEKARSAHASKTAAQGHSCRRGEGRMLRRRQQIARRLCT
jgi:hypothetical protein